MATSHTHTYICTHTHLSVIRQEHTPRAYAALCRCGVGVCRTDDGRWQEAQATCFSRGPHVRGAEQSQSCSAGGHSDLASSGSLKRHGGHGAGVLGTMPSCCVHASLASPTAHNTARVLGRQNATCALNLPDNTCQTLLILLHTTGVCSVKRITRGLPSTPSEVSCPACAPWRGKPIPQAAPQFPIFLGLAFDLRWSRVAQWRLSNGRAHGRHCGRW